MNTVVEHSPHHLKVVGSSPTVGYKMVKPVTSHGRNLGRVFNSRLGRAWICRSIAYITKQSNLKLKTRPKQLLGFFPPVKYFQLSIGDILLKSVTCVFRGTTFWLCALHLYVKVVLIRLQTKKEPKIFIHTSWCHNYMRLNFCGYEFDKSGLLKAVLIHFLKSKKCFFFSNLKN